DLDHRDAVALRPEGGRIVGEDRVEERASAPPVLCFGRFAGRTRDHAPRRRVSLEDAPQAVVALENEQAPPAQLGGFRRRSGRGDRLEANGEVEGRAEAGRALDPDVAAEELAQSPADDQAETATAILPRCRSID